MKVIASLLGSIGLILIVSGDSSIFAQPTGQIVAVVNGRNVTQEEVDNAVRSEIFALQQQIYAHRKAALENLISRLLLEEEAGRRRVSLEELKRQLTAGKVEISSDQVEQLYSQNASVFAAMSPDEAKERLRLDLESQARMKFYREALTALKKNSSIEVRLEEPRLPVIDNGKSPTIGLKEARVTIIEFSDFQCPHCRQAQSALKKVLQHYASNIKLVFKHLPLDIHPDAIAAGQAAFCAGEQDYFWQYHDALFALDSFSTEMFKKLASRLGLDISRFGTCLDSKASNTAVLADIGEARRLGIDSTPTFIINGRLFRGAGTFEEFQAVIERELKLAQSKPHPELKP